MGVIRLCLASLARNYTGTRTKGTGHVISCGRNWEQPAAIHVQSVGRFVDLLLGSECCFNSSCPAAVCLLYCPSSSSSSFFPGLSSATRQHCVCLVLSCDAGFWHLLACYAVFLFLYITKASERAFVKCFALESVSVDSSFCGYSPPFFAPKSTTIISYLILSSSPQVPRSCHCVAPPLTTSIMVQPGHLPMAAITKVKTTAQRGSRWLKRRFNSRRDSQGSAHARRLSIVGSISPIRINASHLTKTSRAHPRIFATRS